MCVYIKSSHNDSQVTKFDCGCHEILIIKICNRLINYYISALYRNPNLNNDICGCLLNSMAVVQN